MAVDEGIVHSLRQLIGKSLFSRNVQEQLSVMIFGIQNGMQVDLQVEAYS
jgi:hypothetical protein